jgi:catechol 2,3-dioxygenase-like lactoylglutathione lyase family enzyme
MALTYLFRCSACQEVFGLPVFFEDANSVVFKFGSTLANLLKTEAAVHLVEPAAVADREAGVRFQLTVEVDDVDATCTTLTARGARLLNGPMDRSWGVRTASFMDPVATSGRSPNRCRDEGRSRAQVLRYGARRAAAAGSRSETLSIRSCRAMLTGTASTWRWWSRSSSSSLAWWSTHSSAPAGFSTTGFSCWRR